MFSYHWLCAAVNKDQCGRKTWNCSKCKVGGQKKETCVDLDINLPTSLTDQHGKPLDLSKRKLGRHDIGDNYGHGVEKMIYKGPGCVKNGKVGTETEKSKSLDDSKVGEAVLFSVESTEAMDELSLNDESIEAMEEWLQKN